ncbi:TPA: hypothetical protein DCR49_10675 [Candidatus Delongbacteria bacterium]|nr:hypothetical protein [Candidatus Delongbacteria bacterium]
MKKQNTILQNTILKNIIISISLTVILIVVLIRLFNLYIPKPIEHVKSRSVIRSIIEATILNSFTSKNADNVIKYFTASKDWKVERMLLIKGRFQKNPAGELFACNKDNKKNVIIKLSKCTNNYENIHIVKAEEVPVILNIDEMNKENSTSHYRLNTILEGREISIIIMINNFNKKEFQSLITEINEIINTLQDLSDFKENTDTESIINILPKGSYKFQDKNEINIVYNDCNQIVIEGYANAKKKGCVFLKVMDKMKREISDPGANYNDDNIEFIGWSDNDSIKFYYKLDRQYVSGKEGYEIDAECELWFHPYDGIEDELLTKKSIIIKFTPPSGPDLF